ncbi:hypothetical protein KPL78_11285 [Roseomonas sp. HJA6]|uniref:Uncharacterized protein n=1 Tax=Roseomonas alba TaxID=2846776 RepID=A0ABS7A837_9PROT|nr:hypothetical protein [Neoroseomonas alba]MBW6398436.1 hypothetical protein [Neoroseomonas alba]
MGTLKLTLFHVGPVAPWANTVFHKQIEKGNAFLRPHGLRFEAYPASGSLDLDWSAPLLEQGRSGEGLAQRLALRAMAHARYASFDNRLPVILCQIGGGGGESPGSIDQKLNWLPWVVMDAFTLNEDGLTLTHEAGHCAGLKHPGHGPQGDSRLVEDGHAVTDNLMAYGTFDMATQKYGGRTLIDDWQIDAFRHAYFHSA